MNCADIEKYDFENLIEDPNKRLELVIYDIIDNKRRRNMVKVLESFGKRVQLSAFEVLVTPAMHRKMINQIVKIIDEEDNVRIYRLNSSNEILLIGSSFSVYEENIIIV